MFFILTGFFIADAAEMPLVRANYAAISGAFAPLWIATERGLFPKHGLNVIIPAAAVQTLLNFASHQNAKTAKPESFIDNSILSELGKSGFVDKLYK
jgi:ABC-type nitrate/sulfonate/bicarbonate transport system substrate-binding protein